MEALWAASPIDGIGNKTHHEMIPEHMEMFYGDEPEAAGNNMDCSSNEKELYM